jgi:hypothetical protein
MMVPMLTEIIGEAAQSKIRAFLIGMAHRGRLNVLAHVLRKPYAQILAEFKDPVGRIITVSEYLGWSGDVKYHAGALLAVSDGSLDKLVVQMVPNPSHLEHVNPVIAGMARAAGTKVDRPRRPILTQPVAAAGYSRRCLLCRAGYCGGNAEHASIAGLSGGGDYPHHRQQPVWLYRQPGSQPQHPLRQRHGQGL